MGIEGMTQERWNALRLRRCAVCKRGGAFAAVQWSIKVADAELLVCGDHADEWAAVTPNWRGIIRSVSAGY